MLNEPRRHGHNTARSWSENSAAQRRAVRHAAPDRDMIAALLRLSVRQRRVVFLTYSADLPPGDVAALFDSSLRAAERELRPPRGGWRSCSMTTNTTTGSAC